MKVEELEIGDTINGMIIYDNVKLRYGVDGQVEVPLIIPGGFDLDTYESLDSLLKSCYQEFNGRYYSMIHPYTFDSDTELDLERYVVLRNGKRIT